MKNIFVVLFILLLAACYPSQDSAERQISQAIEYHGGEAYKNLKTEFVFRDKKYKLAHDAGLFTYERIFQDSLGREINDILTNDGFVREVNGEAIELSEKDSAAYANSVNSVHYFALLPYNLNDEAVKAHNIDDILINGQAYSTVEVRFGQEGGGTDFEDVFTFWFNSKTYDLDYFAYSYHTDGGGVRFRESIKKQRIEGVIFRDYNNYEAPIGTDLTALPSLFEQNKLKLLSVIDLEFNAEDL